MGHGADELGPGLLHLLQGLGQAVEVEGELPELVPLQKGKADPVLPLGHPAAPLGEEPCGPGEAQAGEGGGEEGAQGGEG